MPFGALADNGLTVLVFVTPADAGVGDVIDINVEVHLWDALVDADGLAGSASGTLLNFTNVTTGKYHANFTIASSSFAVTVQASLGALADAGRGFFTVVSVAAPPTTWTVRARFVSASANSAAPSPGDTVAVEARSYLGAALTDGGPINATVSHAVGLSVQNDPLNGTKASAGVYRFSYTVPAAITTSSVFNIEATLGTGFLAPADFLSFSVDPFRVIVLIAAQTATSASLRIYVGDSSAVAGASVSLQGEGLIFTPPYVVTAGPFNATTNAAGFASIDATWSASSFLSFTLTVTSGGKTSTSSIAFGALAPGGWTPPSNYAFGCSLALQTNPATIQPGQSSTLKFRMTEQGAAVASREVTRWVWRDNYDEGAAQGGNTTTDASGNFTVTYAFPANFTSDDTLVVLAVCPSGNTSNVDAHMVPTYGVGGRVDLTLGAATTGGSLPVTATVAGASVPDGTYAYASIVPGSSTGAALASGNTHLPSTELTRSGATFTGNVSVPSWLPAGDFVVLVTVSNRGGADSLDHEATFYNASVAHVGQGAQTQNPPPVTPPAKGFLPGFDGLAALAAIGAVGTLVVAGRRRRCD